MNTAILDRRVLVLNKSWVPIDIWALRDAITLLFKTEDDGITPKAKVVKYSVEDVGAYTWEDWAKLLPHDKESALKSSCNAFKIPEIIVLQGCNRFPKPKSTFNRRAIYALYKNTCQYCGKRFSSAECTIDHVIPRSQGGKTTWDNCVLACVKCNGRKKDRTPEEAHMKLLCGKPKKPTAKILDIGDVRCKSWQNFLDASYWNVELED